MSNEDMIWVKEKGDAFGTPYVPYSTHERLMIEKDQYAATLRAEVAMWKEAARNADAPSEALRAEVERLTADNTQLRKRWADFANRINIAGSASERAVDAIAEMVRAVKSEARAALAEEKKG